MDADAVEAILLEHYEEKIRTAEAVQRLQELSVARRERRKLATTIYCARIQSGVPLKTDDAFNMADRIIDYDLNHPPIHRPTES